MLIGGLIAVHENIILINAGGVHNIYIYILHIYYIYLDAVKIIIISTEIIVLADK